MGRKQANLLSGFWLVLGLVCFVPQAQADEPGAALQPISADTSVSRDLSGASSPALAQAADANAIELAPVKLPERRSASETFNSFETGILYKLPSRMFFNANVENSLRLETNVFQTLHHNKSDMIYRPAPNVTLGYALTRRTRVAANYFYFRDQYTRNDTPLSRNVQSVGARIDQDIPLTAKTTATVGIMNRTLFVSHSRWLNDILPSISISRPIGYHGYVYGSVIGQLRWYDAFSTMQEGDQFYSFGGVYRRGPWILSADNTFISSFRKRPVAGPTNQAFVLTFEVARRVVPRMPLPLYAFVRTQPIFNIGSNQVLGFAGVNYRLFGGLRIDLNKPAIFPVKLARL
jgi:hypothetical protein